jgi:hypothetical protein
LEKNITKINMVKHKHLSTWHNLRIGVFCAFSVILLLSSVLLTIENGLVYNTNSNPAKASNLIGADTALGGQVTFEKIFLINGKEEDSVNINHNTPVTVRLKYNNLGDFPVTSVQIKDSVPVGFIYVPDSFRNCLTPSSKETFCDKADTAQRNLDFLALTEPNNPGLSPIASLYDGPLDLYSKKGTAGGAKSGLLDIGKKRYIHQYRCVEEYPNVNLFSISSLLTGTGFTTQALNALRRDYSANDWYITKPEAEGIDNKNAFSELAQSILDNLFFDFDNEQNCKPFGPSFDILGAPKLIKRYSQNNTIDLRIKNTNNRFIHTYRCVSKNANGKNVEVNDWLIPLNENGGANNRQQLNGEEMAILDYNNNCKEESNRKSEQSVFDTLGYRFVHHYVCKDNNSTQNADEVNDWHIPGKNEQGVNNKSELTNEDIKVLDELNKCSGKGSRKSSTRKYDMLDNTRGSGYLEYTMKSPFMTTLYSTSPSMLSTSTTITEENYNPILKPIILNLVEKINVITPGTTIPNQTVYTGNPSDQADSDKDTNNIANSNPTNNEPNGNTSNNVIDPVTGTTNNSKVIVPNSGGKVTIPATGPSNNVSQNGSTSSTTTNVPKNGEIPVTSTSTTPAPLVPPKITINALVSSKSSVCQLGQVEQKDSSGKITCKTCSSGSFCDGITESTAKFASEDPYICGSSITGAALGYDSKTDRIKVKVTRNSNAATANAEPTPTTNGFFEIPTDNLSPDTYFIEFELFRNSALIANTSRFTAYINKLEQCNSTPTVRTGGYGSIIALMVFLGTLSIWGALYYHEKHKTHLQQQYIKIDKE